jgi:hypothetical protein
MLQTFSDNGEGRPIAGTPPLSKYYALIKNFHNPPPVDNFAYQKDGTNECPALKLLLFEPEQQQINQRYWE